MKLCEKYIVFSCPCQIAKFGLFYLLDKGYRVTYNPKQNVQNVN